MANMVFVLFRKLRIEIRFTHAIHYIVDGSSFPEPTVKFLVPKPDTECIDASENIVVLIPYEVYSLLSGWMFPIKIALIFFDRIRHVAVSLIFYVKELRRVEPGSGIVFAWAVTNRLSHYFAHHAGSIPDLFNIFSACKRIGPFNAIANGINTRDVCLKVLIDKYTFLHMDSRTLQPRHIGMNADGDAGEIACDLSTVFRAHADQSA